MLLVSSLRTSVDDIAVGTACGISSASTQSSIALQNADAKIGAYVWLPVGFLICSGWTHGEGERESWNSGSPVPRVSEFYQPSVPTENLGCISNTLKISALFALGILGPLIFTAQYELDASPWSFIDLCQTQKNNPLSLQTTCPL